MSLAYQPLFEPSSPVLSKDRNFMKYKPTQVFFWEVCEMKNKKEYFGCPIFCFEKKQWLYLNKKEWDEYVGQKMKAHRNQNK